MKFIRNYFITFVLAYLIILVTKFVFLIFYHDRFAGYPVGDLLHAILWGVRFDFAISAFVALLVNLFNFNTRLLRSAGAVIPALLATLQLSDILYFEEASRHISYEINDALHDAGGLLMTALSQNTLFTLTAFVLFPVLTWLFYRLARQQLQPIRLDWFYLPKQLLLLVLSVFFIRGMLSAIPLTPWQAAQIGDVRLATLALNGSYSTVFSLFTPNSRLTSRYRIPASDEEIRHAFRELYGARKTATQAPAGRTNVILFFLEGWSAAYMKPYGFHAETTPNFDRFLQGSLRPRGALAGGHRTTEGIFSTLVSYQNPLGQSVADSQLQNYGYESLINLFHDAGYRSLFFQGTSKETTGTGSLAQKLGFHESYGKRDITQLRYPPNSWGVQDPDLYNFVLQKLGNTQVPFIIGINGATTHDDQVPDGVTKQAFVDDPRFNARLNALHFADKALGDFVEKIRQQYPNTLFVFFADHTGWVSNRFQNYLIPLAFYGSMVKPAYVDSYLSQRDIAPTVVDLVLGDYRKLAPDFSGKSLVSDEDFFADYFHNGVLGWVKGKTVLELNLQTLERECFEVSTHYPRPMPCPDTTEHMERNMRAFTHVSQKLLFEGKTKDFHQYRGNTAREQPSN